VLQTEALTGGMIQHKRVMMQLRSEGRVAWDLLRAV